MGCIISGMGIKTKWSNRTLCGKVNSLQDIIEFYTGKVNCIKCLVKQDAMLMRGYEQTKYTVWYNREGRANMVLYDEFHKVDQYGNRTFKWHTISIPRNPKQVDGILMWDADMVKGAIKLGKLGCADMGIAKK